MYKYLHFFLAVILITACASTAATETVSPTSPETIEGNGINVEVEGTHILILDVKEGQYYASQVVKTQAEAEQDALAGQYHIANDGSRFVQVTLQVLSGADSKDVYEWKILLKDTQETLYEVAIRSSGLFAGGANNISWIYVVPNENEISAVVFPGDITVDLESLLQVE